MKYDVTIIGGGIVGLATAWQLKQKNPHLKLLLIEKEPQLAAHQTGNNSGVIHSGLYYKPGSLKAINCINGYGMLIDFCRKEGIAYKLCGKVVVATSKQELPMLRALHERGLENGLVNNRMITAAELKELEPYASGLEGIWVPYTGIVNYKEVADRLGVLISSLDGRIHLGESLTQIRRENGSATLVTTKETYETKVVVNCAGLYSDKVARMTGRQINIKIIPFRGEYYKLKEDRRYLVKNLIYPVPNPAFPFLGVHFTSMVSGEVEVGPNAVLAFGRESYHKSKINPAELVETLAWPGFRKVASKYWRTGLEEMHKSFSKAAFTRALQKLLPDITEADLLPGGSGVRAQACDRQGGLLDDFLIEENELAVNVCNAPSPAATSSLAIGNSVSDIVLKRF